MFDDETVKRLMGLSEDASKKAEREYIGIDADDIAGHIMEQVYRAPHRWERHLDSDAWLWSVMYAEGISYCRKQVRDFMWYSAEHFYTPQEIRELLEKVYTTDSENAEYVAINDATISLIDLQIAFNKLPARDRDLIVRKVKDHSKLEESDRRAFYRATERMATILNGTLAGNTRARVEHEGPGARTVLSNAQAITETRRMESV